MEPSTGTSCPRMILSGPVAAAIRRNRPSSTTKVTAPLSASSSSAAATDTSSTTPARSPERLHPPDHQQSKHRSQQREKDAEPMVAEGEIHADPADREGHHRQRLGPGGSSHSTRLFPEKLAEGGLARREHAPEVGAAEPALPAAAGLPDKLGQRPSRRPG